MRAGAEELAFALLLQSRLTEATVGLYIHLFSLACRIEYVARVRGKELLFFCDHAKQRSTAYSPFHLHAPLTGHTLHLSRGSMLEKLGPDVCVSSANEMRVLEITGSNETSLSFGGDRCFCDEVFALLRSPEREVCTGVKDKPKPCFRWA